MGVKIIPQNNNWNRKYKFTDNGSGYLIETKNGMSYFSWKFTDGKTKFYKCEEPVFEKSFERGEEIPEIKTEVEKAPEYLRYPMEM